MSFLKKLQSINLFSFLKVYSFFFKYVEPYKYRFFMALIITFPLGLMDGLLAGSIKPFFDALAGGQQTLDFGFFTAPISWIPLFIIVLFKS